MNDERKTKKQLISELDDLRREAEVEAGLERVRAAALAMQKTEDLPSVTAAVFREVGVLGFDIFNNSVAVVDADRDLQTQWTSLPADLDSALLERLGPVFKEDPWVVRETFSLSTFYRLGFPEMQRLWRAGDPSGPPVHVCEYVPKAKHMAWHERMVELGLWPRELA